MNGNSATSRSQTLNQVMMTLGNREEQILGMLPHDLPLERFKANIQNALSSNPKLLDCEAHSIVQACMKAAYDGLRIDGREAAIIDREITINRGKSGERKIRVAGYMPMAFGLIQQVLRGGEVKTMEADVIHENDEYHVQRGTAPGIHHIPNLLSDRGPIIAAYSVATWGNGAKTFELLTRADLSAIKAMAQTKDVWERWPGEMSKKSAIRRHRKTLPIGNRDIVIRDSEANELYPEMQQAGQALPAPTSTPRPTRQQIASRQGTESGAPLDLVDHDEDGVVIDQREPEKKPQPRKRAAKADGPPAEIPEDEDAWRAWATATEKAIVEAPSADAVNVIAAAEKDRMAAASKERADYLRGLISDRLTDFATEGQEA